jgi:hypothetical protein
MSHTSQRRGLDPSRPGEELIVLAMITRAFRSKEGIDEAMNELAGKMLEHGRDHWPQWTVDRFTALANGPAPDSMEVVFTDLKRVENLLNDLKRQWLPRNRKEGYPVSIVLTGLTGDIEDICRKTGFTQHTYLHSLGAFGRVGDLPVGDELSLITMCGHGLVATNRIRDLVKRIKKGEITPEGAAADIAKPCQCGIVNKKRAQEIFGVRREKLKTVKSRVKRRGRIYERIR